MKSAITICLVPEAARGPFVFHDGLSSGCQHAADAGFDAVEIFPPSASEFPSKQLHTLLEQTSLDLAAVGTGAGWLKKRLSLTDTDPARRREAIQFVAEIIEIAAEFNAPAIIGSMQGQASDITHRSESLGLLAEALGTLGDHAQRHGQVLLYEALNRYETNLLNTQEDAANFLIKHSLVGNGSASPLRSLSHEYRRAECARDDYPSRSPRFRSYWACALGRLKQEGNGPWPHRFNHIVSCTQSSWVRQLSSRRSLSTAFGIRGSQPNHYVN